MAFIYKATNKQNGKFYIGQTSYNKLNKRIACHIHYANNSNSNLPFPNALRKYGRNGFIWEILEECDKEKRGEREIFWIKELNPHYNATLGGDGGTLGRKCPEHVKEATRKSRIVSVKDRTTGKIYNSMKEAKEDTGVLESSISRSIKINNSKCRWEKINT
jgi:group I intron endonuclease